MVHEYQCFQNCISYILMHVYNILHIDSLCRPSQLAPNHKICLHWLKDFRQPEVVMVFNDSRDSLQSKMLLINVFGV